MRFLLLFSLLFSTIIYADAALEIKKGWQLTSLPQQIDDMSLFDNNSTLIVWSFDASTQSWQGYSHDAAVQSKITDAGYTLLKSLKPWQAFWIHSTSAWTASFDTAATVPQNPLNTHLELKTGWNLVALPSKTVVAADLFDDMTVWKYSDKWQVHSNSSMPFPPIDEISTGEGLWVKSDKDRNIDLNEKSSKLHTFASEEEMLKYIRSMLKNYRHPYYGYIDFDMTGGSDFSANNEDNGAIPSSNGDAPKEQASDATSTNLQEEGVDESDILKHDGEHIFFVDQENGRIHITSFADIAAGNYTPLQEIPLEKEQYIQAMYLQNNRLSVISHKNIYYIMQDGSKSASAVYPPQQIQKFQLDIYDVSDISSIKLLSSMEIEGDYRESRMIEGRLVLILHFYPQIRYEYPIIYPKAPGCVELKKKIIEIEHNGSINNGVACGSNMQCPLPKPGSTELQDLYRDFSKLGCYRYNYDENATAWYYDYDNPTVLSEYLVPTLTTEGKTVKLLKPETFYAPYKMDQSADITIISTIDTAEGNYTESISFLGSTHTYYASSKSLYLVSSQYPLYYDFEYFREQQAVYQFNISEKLSYVGRGFVDGRMLNQYSMSEYNDTLRVATTSGNSWSTTGTDNALFVLKGGNNKELEIIGSLHGLGKNGETIHAVRFIGDRGFVVTFRRTDPFYTLDLKDPKAPAIAGSLEIPGFSEYFHPVDENRILSIGRDADSAGVAQGLQIQLFDISDFSNPALADKITIGNSRTYSEAEHNPRVFAYRNSDKMFGLPYRKGYQDVYFGLYQVNGLQIDSIADLYENTQDKWSYSPARGVIFDYNGSTYGALFQGDHIICKTIPQKAKK